MKHVTPKELRELRELLHPKVPPEDVPAPEPKRPLLRRIFKKDSDTHSDTHCTE